MGRVFISYRREDSATHAGRLHDLLVHRFGARRVFMDVYALEPGVNFKETISRYLGQCKVALVIIGKRWLDITDASGHRRLDSADDLVRYEIETALARGIAVVPVLVDDASMPPESSLPDALKPLARLHALPIDNVHFPRDSARLLRTVRRMAGSWPVWIWFDWRFAAAVVLAGLIAILHAAPVSQAQAELDLKVSQFSFRLRHPGSVLAGVRLNRLGIAGLREVVLPGRGAVPAAALQLEALSSGDGGISLPSLVAPEGTHVWYGRKAGAGELSIGLEGPALEFQVSVVGRMRIGLANSGSFAEEFSTPQPVVFKADSDAVDLFVVNADPAGGELVRQVDVDSAAFVDVEYSETRGDPVVRKLSSIREGSIVFFPPAGPRRSIQAGDLLTLQIRNGELRTATATDNEFAVRFTGLVRGVRSNTRNLMPSYLQRLWAAALRSSRD